MFRPVPLLTKSPSFHRMSLLLAPSSLLLSRKCLAFLLAAATVVQGDCEMMVALGARSEDVTAQLTRGLRANRGKNAGCTIKQGLRAL